MATYRRFIGIDGESYTNPKDKKDHRYVLLAASTGDYIYNPRGHSTDACLDFLLAHRQQRKSYLYVAYGLNYDVNMILKDIPKIKLKELWQDHRIKYKSYIIEWIPSKWFSVTQWNTDKDGKKTKVTCRIYDVFGFFQRSFVGSLEDWEIEVPGDIEAMKQQRSIFDSTMKQEIIDYCIDECKALVALMNKLSAALKAVDISPSSWVGAGAIASGLMKREGVRDLHVYDDHETWPREVGLAIYHAYFGGRVELFQQGPFPTLYDYDVRSAYPSIALNLPALTLATWRKVKEFEPGSLNAVYRVEWKVPVSKIIMPFPFRSKKNIYYPSTGHGWYHAAEVRRAVQLYERYLTIHEGWVMQPNDEAKPFLFIRQEFEHRDKLKKENHPGQKVLKLGLNAIYGKLAQGVGFRGSPPPYQSYYWAGAITSGTRAKLLDAASLSPESLVMMATDGIFFTDELDLSLSDQLGGWEASVMSDCFIAQPGVYTATDEEGFRFAKSRGFFARELDFDSLLDGYNTDGPYHTAEYVSTRFIGLGSALVLKDFDKWATWNTDTRKLAFYPNRKFLQDKPFDKETMTGTPVRHVPGTAPDTFSEVYVPKDGENKWAEDVIDYIQGTEQPLRDY